MKLFHSFILLVAFGSFVLTWGQQGSPSPSPQSDPKPTAPKKGSEPINVKLSAWVLNKDNNAVINLPGDQFAIFEDEVEQKLTVEQKSGPLKLIMVVDNSGSMRSVLGSVAMAANFFVQHLEDNDQCELIRFISSDKIEEMQTFTSDKALLKKGIDAMYIEGGQSAVIDALYLAIQKLQAVTKDDASVRRAIVVFTDGEDRNSFYKLEHLVSLLDKSCTPIFFLKLPGSYERGGREKSEKLVNYLALLTGGSAHPITTASELLPEVASVSLEIRSPYVLSYTSTNPSWDGTTRKLRVAVRQSLPDDKLVVVARTKYVVPKR